MTRKPRQVPASISALGAALKAMRKQRELTQAGLGERTGRNQAHISAIENGTFDARASTLLALAAALGCEWVLVPKDRVGEAMRSAGLGGRSPATVLEEVFVPDPEDGDGD